VLDAAVMISLDVANVGALATVTPPLRRVQAWRPSLVQDLEYSLEEPRRHRDNSAPHLPGASPQRKRLPKNRGLRPSGVRKRCFEREIGSEHTDRRRHTETTL